MGLKTIMISIFRLLLSFDEIDSKWHHENSENSHVIYPMGTALPGSLPKIRYAGAITSMENHGA